MKPETKHSPQVVAAVAAVLGYIRSEEDAMQAMTVADGAGEFTASPYVPVKLWGISGRQEMMNMRNLMQLRTFQGSKLR